MKLESSSALVTGGASGLGEAAARELARRGAQVVIADLNTDRGKSVADEIDGAFVQVDVTDTDQVITAIDAAVAMGPLRSVVNSAGISGIKLTVGDDKTYDSAHCLEWYRKIVEIDLVGTFNVNRLAATAMSRADVVDGYGERGSIVNVSSISAFEGWAGQAAYASAKAGVLGLTTLLSRELSVHGIRVNAISPGMVLTPIYDGIDVPVEDLLRDDVVFPHRFGTPAEFATMAVELLTNSYMNGELIRLHGGGLSLAPYGLIERWSESRRSRPPDS